MYFTDNNIHVYTFNNKIQLDVEFKNNISINYLVE